MSSQGVVLDINGPIIGVRVPGLGNGEQVRVGEVGLIGEVIGLEGETARVQLYESSEGLRPGEPVMGLGHPLSVMLGPGLMAGIFDGTQRPLQRIAQLLGDNIPRGVAMPALDQDQRWRFTPEAGLNVGQSVSPGQFLGRVPETASIEHRVMVPPDLSGQLLELAPEGEYSHADIIARVQDNHGQVRDVHLSQQWPVRVARPYQRRDHAVVPLLTGQRILDTFFPLLKGGKGAVPGPFGAGKTMVQQQVARWANADIVVYVGCGERGNELVDVLESFPGLTDPRSGRPLMDRTLLVANTSNMPVVAREASIYVGLTIAEYYRDMGYDVVMLADSTSRWAEAMREVAGRLGHMPVEEGYPAYLASRLAGVYERAGRVHTQSGELGSVTLIGAVSPPGGDFSEPVTAHTKEIIQTFWALSKELAEARHYPSVDWVDSFSLDVPVAAQWWHEQVSPQWETRRAEALSLLARDAELERMVNLVGPEALSSAQRWELEAAAMIKDAVLQQSALDEIDSYCSPEKQFVLLNLVMSVFEQGADLIKLGVPVQQLSDMPMLAKLRRLKSSFSNEQLSELDTFRQELEQSLDRMRSEYLAGEVDHGDS